MIDVSKYYNKEVDGLDIMSQALDNDKSFVTKLEAKEKEFAAAVEDETLVHEIIKEFKVWFKDFMEDPDSFEEVSFYDYIDNVQTSYKEITESVVDFETVMAVLAYVLTAVE